MSTPRIFAPNTVFFKDPASLCGSLPGTGIHCPGVSPVHTGSVKPGLVESARHSHWAGMAFVSCRASIPPGFCPHRLSQQLRQTRGFRPSRQPPALVLVAENNGSERGEIAPCHFRDRLRLVQSVDAAASIDEIRFMDIDVIRELPPGECPGLESVHQNEQGDFRF
ncbi:MAG: hypothetical protein AW09_002010 [Candidatus Accumulibacter phosphatis]|uniref:Uncharacterized protein n=1 Tax=Candidatus Accumulibacter phosphatis TaxID=327160 RepID=A0A080M6P4_9PROT|nr:MAG: hypothetical protein AW09_002010 [Candidatus Accumulibacter phosphatis]